MPDTCSTCSAWFPTDGPRDEAAAGECRRYAPTPTTSTVLAYPTAPATARAVWPLTFANEACAEHAPT